MRNKHITRFGDPTTISGALYFVTDQEGVFQMAIDMESARLYEDGVIITPSMRSRVVDRTKRDQMIYHSKITQKGISESLKVLLNIDRKSDVEKFCRKLSVSEIDLILLIHNCSQIDFTHQTKFPEYVPSHLEITTDDEDELKKAM